MTVLHLSGFMERQLCSLWKQCVCSDCTCTHFSISRTRGPVSTSREANYLLHARRDLQSRVPQFEGFFLRVWPASVLSLQWKPRADHGLAIWTVGWKGGWAIAVQRTSRAAYPHSRTSRARLRSAILTRTSHSATLSCYKRRRLPASQSPWAPALSGSCFFRCMS